MLEFNLDKLIYLTYLFLHVFQRIERFWRQLRNNVIQFWMDIFKNLETSALFIRANEVHV